MYLAERAQTHSGHDNRDLRYIFIYKYVKFDHKCACVVILEQHSASVCRLRGRGFDTRIGTFFSLLFFSVSFFPLSFSFMLAPPFQCSSIFLVILYSEILTNLSYGHPLIPRHPDKRGLTVQSNLLSGQQS